MSQELKMTSWGHEISLYASTTVRFAAITVSPSQESPWLCYAKADAIFYVKFGHGDVRINNEVIPVVGDQSFTVQRGDWSQVINTSDGPLILYRMMCGDVECQPITDAA